MHERALDGVKVLDFGQIYNGPYCGLILSYLGADVIRIEPPHGDPLRKRTDEGEPVPLMLLNSSKKGITLDLKEEEGKELFEELVADADVVVENFRVGTMERLGLGYDSLSEINPELVYAHGSGYGEHGPYQEYPAMDLTIQAMSGVMDVTGFPDGPPTKAGIAVADFLGGIHLATGVLAALYQREHTSEGQFVEVSMFDAVFPSLTSPLGAHLSGADAPSRTGNRHSALAQCPYNVYAVADGYVALFCVQNSHWHSLLEILGREDLVRDERYETNYKRTQHMDEIDKMIQTELEDWERDALVDELLAAGVPCGPVHEIGEVVEDPHLEERDMIVEIDHPDFGKLPAFGSPIRLSKSEEPAVEPSPLQGEHTRQVLREELGLDDSEIELLEEKGIL